MLRLVAVCTLALASGPMFADTVTVNLAVSSQAFTLSGTGGFDGYGTYLAEPGTCVAGITITTCTLSGTYSGTTPGFTSGLYSFVTTFNSTDEGLLATSTTKVAVDGGNYFTMGPEFASDVNMTLNLDGADPMPVTVDGSFVADNLYINATDSQCRNLPQGVPCTQGNVGLSAGSSIFSTVTQTVVFSVAPTVTPEPEWLALESVLAGMLLILRGRRKRLLENSRSGVVISQSA